MADSVETAGGAQGASAGKGKGSSWAPTRGYFEVKGGSGGGGAAKAAVKKAAPKKAAVEATAAPAEVPAGAAPAAAAAPKAAAKPKEAPKAAPAPKLDPERDSVTTVETLAGSALGKVIAGQIYDNPDSETTLYRVGSLNALFAIASLLLLVVTVAVVWQDYAKPWKEIQAGWNEIVANQYESEFLKAQALEGEELKKLEPTLAAILRKIAPEEAPEILAELDSRGVAGSPARMQTLVNATQSRFSKKFAEYEQLLDAFKSTQTRYTLADKALRAFRGEYQAAKYRLDEEKRHILDKLGDTQAAAGEIRKHEDEFAEKYGLALEKLDGEVEKLDKVELKEAKEKLESYENTQTLVGDGKPDASSSLPAVRKALGDAARQVTDSRKKVDLVEKTWRNFVRNMPFVDFLAPSYKIEHVVLKDLHEDLNFETVPRIERCKTCHVNVDNPDPSTVFVSAPVGKPWGTVYRSHPRLDLFVGSSSPHPYEAFGCTPCHQGDGHATDFITAAHTPSDEAQAKRWEKDYGWEPLHHQDYPMLKREYLTSQCMKCHTSDHKLDGGGSFNLGYEVIKTYGCYGCHKIPIFEDCCKVGPTLTHLADKADTQWIYKWVRNPQHFRPTTRMPRFFDLTNTTGKMLANDQKGESAHPSEIDFDVRNGVEALAIATFLESTSERNAALPKLTAQGDAVRGRALFLETGCLGCHSVRRESISGARDGAVNGDKVGDDLATPVAKAVEALAAVVASISKGSTAEEIAKGQRTVAAATTAREALEKLLAWSRTLSIGHNLEELYHAVAVPLEDLVRENEALGAEGGAATVAKAAARSIYDRWIHNTFAPDLSSIGSKVRSAEWLASWITDPRSHDPKTTMPRFRLDQNEKGESSEAGPQRVADIVAYLMTLRDSEFEKGEVFSMASPEAMSVLKDLAFDYKKRSVTRAEAESFVAANEKSPEALLQFVGHRLIRRYGCFGCHNGIKDMVEKDVEQDGKKVKIDVVQGTFDETPRIGADLSEWGFKMPAFLDFGYWGHQHSGREAIGHNRYDWAKAKLTDTRRFDVIPSEKLVAEDEYEYAPTNRLIQKTPEELLKMPRFAFVDDPAQVEAVVTILAGLVKDKIPLEKRHRHNAEEEALEAGNKLIAKLNCQGCHRIGAETKYVPVSKLPTYSPASSSDEDARRGELEKETWLAKGMRLSAYTPEPKEPGDLPAGKILPSIEGFKNEKGEALKPSERGLWLPRSTLIREQVFDRTTMDSDFLLCEPKEDPLSVVELAAGPLNPESKVQGNFKARKIMDPRAHLLPVAGFEEGKIRYYFGGNDERGGAEQRPLGPPPLVRQGQRVRGEWLFHFLLNVEPIRPWLKVRMPSFYLKPEEAQTLVRWFRVNGEVPEANELIKEDTFDPSLADAGRQLFGPTVGQKVGLQCNNCHPAGPKLPTYPTYTPEDKGLDYTKFPFAVPGDKHYVVWQENGSYKHQSGFAGVAEAQAWATQNLAGKKHWVGDPWSKTKWGPDLSKAATRLRPTWIRNWLTSPTDFMPGTIMPNFFGNRDPLKGVLYLHAQASIDKLAADPQRSADVERALKENAKTLDSREKIESLIQYLVHMQRVEGTVKAAD